MAQRELEPEVVSIFEHIQNSQNFLLSGGAGSGKTYSLVQVIKEIIEKNPTVKVACMTYTNAAVKEIEERVNHNNLQVSTIHDFLWANIKSFQKELKKSLITLMNDVESKIKSIDDSIVGDDYFDNLEDGIQYKEYFSLKNGIISHDEVLILANYMFKTYSKLSDIIKDKFKFILIDEYQDTNPQVVEIFLTHLKQSNRKNIIGFFGDAMQSIYDEGIGDLSGYLNTDVFEVQKKQNRRNPQFVINLANKVRTDRLTQEPSTDENAPNMEDGTIRKGIVKFYYSTSDLTSLDGLKEQLGWNFEETKETKELNLTHNLIAPKAGFGELMEIYDGDKIIDYKNRIKDYIKDNNITIDLAEKTFGEVIEILSNGKTGKELNKVKPTNGMQTFIDSHSVQFEEAKTYLYEEFRKIYLSKDALIDDKKKDTEDENKKGSKRDNLIKHLFKIQTNINLYQEKKYNEFLQKTEYRITRVSDKQAIKSYIETLNNMADSTIEEVISYTDENGICKKDDKLNSFIEKNQYLYNRVKDLKFKIFQNLFYYLEGYTPFSTQHKIKGAEFDDVLVILDNGKWNNYNFENLFLENGSESVLKRTQKIFYVCCTRAKKNLAVFYNKPSDGVISKAKEWFGEINTIEIS
ncbi:MAG TPA: UvrD-helicase domain-containing protein [Sulfurimonas sp.]|uniref:UvrD-helicase domain-containing protein n=1 Tax=Sulfurimonas sp. TaxID=2022749 RepID=UPI002C37E03B|nr:UvrD-helicase domain-containing protein [Sulfurimonas sp.]HUH43423.1 UvrD-helicase domain-containing protein [Sulfurimonas sp.]